MAKDKKKKKKTKSGKSAGAGPAEKAVNSLKALSQNPFIADVVAAALVGVAAALKDTKKARQLASEAGDELDKMSKQAAVRGSAMWDMALDIGRRSLDALSGEEGAPRRAKSKTASKAPAKAAPRVVKKSPAKRQGARKSGR